MVSSRAAIACTLGVAGLALAACSLVVSSDGLTGARATADASTEASASDAPVDAPSSSDAGVDASFDAGVDAGVVIFQDGFESGCTWGNYQATLSTSDVARTGAQSCKVCSTVTGAYTADKAIVSSAPPLGATYHVEAWVRAVPSGPSSAGASLTLRVFTENPFTSQQDTESPQVSLSQSWTRLSWDMTVSKAGDGLDFYIASVGAPGDCFLIDDAVAYRR